MAVAAVEKQNDAAWNVNCKGGAEHGTRVFVKRDEACPARKPSDGKTGPNVLGKNASKRVSRPQECMGVACRAGARARLLSRPSDGGFRARGCHDPEP